MKQLLLLLTLLLATPLAHAQKKVKEDDSTPTLPTDPDTHKVTYTGVVEVPSTTQAQLYSRAFEWVVRKYNSANNVVQMQDKESGKIVVKGLFPTVLRGRPAGDVSHLLSIYVKDGRYKYEITNLKHEQVVIGRYGGDYSMGPFENAEPQFKMAMMNGIIGKSWNLLRRGTDAHIKELVADLEQVMTAKTKDKSDF